MKISKSKKMPVLWKARANLEMKSVQMKQESSSSTLKVSKLQVLLLRKICLRSSFLKMSFSCRKLGPSKISIRKPWRRGRRELSPEIFRWLNESFMIAIPLAREKGGTLRMTIRQLIKIMSRKLLQR